MLRFRQPKRLKKARDIPVNQVLNYILKGRGSSPYPMAEIFSRPNFYCHKFITINYYFITIIVININVIRTISSSWWKLDKPRLHFLQCNATFFLLESHLPGNRIQPVLTLLFQVLDDLLVHLKLLRRQRTNKLQQQKRGCHKGNRVRTPQNFHREGRLWLWPPRKFDRKNIKIFNNSLLSDAYR